MKTEFTVPEIRFTYKEGYLPTPRCRKLRFRDAEGCTSAQVVLLTEPDVDAPVAFRFTDARLTEAMGHDYWSADGYRVIKEVRLFNGKLYERDHRGNHYAHGRGWYNAKDFVRDFQKFHSGYSHELGRYTESYDDFLAAIKIHAESVIFMAHTAGEIGVWIECGEPRYVYNLFGLGHNHGGTGLFVEQDYNSNIPNTHYFNALDREKAVQAAVTAALRRGDDQSVESIRMCENIEVLLPEAVKVDPETQHGSGDEFINTLNRLTESADSAEEAGILAFAYAVKEIGRTKE